MKRFDAESALHLLACVAVVHAHSQSSPLVQAAYCASDGLDAREGVKGNMAPHQDAHLVVSCAPALAAKAEAAPAATAAAVPLCGGVQRGARCGRR